MKKLISLCLTVVMIVSMFAVSVSAVTINVPSKTFVDKSFVKATTDEADPDITGWTISGANGTDYVFNTWGISPKADKRISVAYDDAFDAGVADYTVTFVAAIYGNTQYYNFATATAADAGKANPATGYSLAVTADPNKNGAVTYKFSKNGVVYEDAVFNRKTSNYVMQDNTTPIVINVTANNITISGGSLAEATVISDNAPIKSGYVGASVAHSVHAWTYRGLKSVSVVADAYSYEMGRPAKDTKAYAEYTVPADELLNVSPAHKASTEYVAAENLEIDPAKTVEISVKANGWVYQNSQTVTFLGYNLVFGNQSPYVSLYSVDNNSTPLTTSTTAEIADLVTDTEWNQGVVTMNIVVDTDKITVYAKNNKNVLEYALPSARVNSGKIAFKYSDNAYHYYKDLQNITVKYSAETQQKAEFIYEKNFTTADTKESLEAEGYTLSNLTAGANDYLASTASGSSTVRYTGHKFGGDYTFEIKGYKDNNDATVYFNYTDANNTYKVFSGSSSGEALDIIKVSGGNPTNLIETDAKGVYTNGRIATYKIAMTTVAEGLQIVVTVTTDEGSESYSCVDTSPLGAGTIGITQGWANTARVYSMKAYPTSTGKVYEGNFYVDGTAKDSIVKGNTVFEYPVYTIGDAPAFIAALYEDNALSDLKLISLDELNNTFVDLFDTSESEAATVAIKVFVWDSLAGMTPVLNPFVLN